ncbi:translocation/assembly module TamB domain-containing protein, partial [Elusimicrobiota bacterium]
MSGDCLIKGKFDEPSVTLYYDIPNAAYGSYTFGNKGSIEYSDGNISAENINVTSGTCKSVFKGEIWPRLSLKGKIQNINVDFLESVAGLQTSVRGKFDGSIEISKSIDNPKISFDLMGDGIYYDKQIIHDCNMKFSIEESDLNISNLVFKYLNTEVLVLNGSVLHLDDSTFSLKTELRNVKAGPMTFYGGLNIEGELNRSIYKTYDVRGIISTRDLWINRHKAEKTFVGFEYTDKVIKLVDFDDYESQLLGEIDINSMSNPKIQNLVMVRGPEKFVIDGSFNKNDLNLWLRSSEVSAATLSEMLDLPISISGRTDLDIVYKGSLDNPNIQGKILISSGVLSEMPFDNLNLKFKVEDNTLTIFESGLINQGNYDISLNGFTPFYLTEASRKRIENNNISLSMLIDQGSLSLVRGLIKDLTSLKGNLLATVNLTGTLANPIWDGYLQVSDGEVKSKKYFKQIKNLNIDLTWENNVLAINEFSARIGNGLTSIAGTIDFENFMPKYYDIKWKTEGEKGIPISIPELPIPSQIVTTSEWGLLSDLSAGKPKFEISIKGPSSDVLVSGWVELENTRFTYPSIVNLVEEDSILDGIWENISLDTEIRTGKNTWYKNSLVEANANGFLKLTGRGDRPVASGKIETTRGVMSYFGAEFNIKHASVEIVNDAVFVEAEAWTEVYMPNQTTPDIVTLYIPKAEVENIEPRFVSRDNPGLSSEKVLARVARVDAEYYNSQDQEFALKRQFIRLIDSSLTTPLARTLIKKSGIVDSFKVEYVSESLVEPQDPDNPTMSELFYGTKYSLGKHLSDQVLFGYSVTFDQIQNKINLRHALELSYRWTRTLFLKGSYELDTENRFGEKDRRVTVERRWRFGKQKGK